MTFECENWRQKDFSLDWISVYKWNINDINASKKLLFFFRIQQKRKKEFRIILFSRVIICSHHLQCVCWFIKKKHSCFIPFSCCVLRKKKLSKFKVILLGGSRIWERINQNRRLYHLKLLPTVSLTQTTFHRLIAKYSKY